MEILAVRARAFGPLMDETLELGPGMSLVWGPNEAGKSSWHAAIFAGLCGMRRGLGSRTNEEKAFIERHKPWSGAAWGVEIDLALGDGRRVQIFQNLDELAACRVTDLDTGADLAAQLDLIHDGTPDGARLLGLSRGTLPATVFIRQTEILKVREDAGELQDAIQRAAATGAADETAERAIQRIDRFHKEYVGERRVNSKRPLQAAINSLEEARERLANAQRAHAEYLHLADRQAAAEEEAARAERELKTARRSIVARDLNALRKRIEGARALAGRLPGGEPPAPMQGFESLETIRAALAAFEERPPEPPPLEGPTAAALEGELLTLPDPPTGDTQPAAEVREASQAWLAASMARGMHQKDEPAVVQPPKTGGLNARELRSLAGRLETRLPEVDGKLSKEVEELTEEFASRRRPGRKKAALIGGVALLLASGGSAAFVHGLLIIAAAVGALLGIGAVVASFVLRWGAPTPEEEGYLRGLEARLDVQREEVTRAEGERRAFISSIKKRGLEPTPDALHALADASDQAEGARGARERWEARAKELDDTERDAARVLWKVLQPRLAGGEAEAGGEGDLNRLVAFYEEECRRRARQAEVASRRPALERAYASRRTLEAKIDVEQQKRRALEEELRRAGRSAGIDEEDATNLTTQLRSFLERAEKEIERRRAARETWNQLRGILGDRTLEDMEAELERRQGELGALGEVGQAEEILGHNPELRLASLETERNAALERRNQLAGEARALESRLAEVSTAEEELQRAEKEMARVERLGATLEQTLRFLADARDRVQRDIAPRLREAVRARLPRITSKRYQEVTVDPSNLEVRVRRAGGEWRPAHLLSHGTSEQIYLLLRIALAEHLITTGESAPLVLDDPTVQSDTTRTNAFLDLLHEISRERQIILFSQEEEVLAWARRNLTDAERDRLHTLATSESGAVSPSASYPAS